MSRIHENIEVIVHYTPNMACQVKALLVLLGYGEAQPSAAAVPPTPVSEEDSPISVTPKKKGGVSS